MWCNLGTCGGGVVGGRQYSRSQCFVESLEMDDQDTRADLAWTSFGDLGGGRVAGQQYSKAQCYTKAVGLDNHDADNWLGLGYAGGGNVSGIEYTASECEAKALELDNQCVEKYHSYSIRVWCGRDGFTTMEAAEACE